MGGPREGFVVDEAVRNLVETFPPEIYRRDQWLGVKCVRKSLLSWGSVNVNCSGSIRGQTQAEAAEAMHDITMYTDGSVLNPNELLKSQGGAAWCIRWGGEEKLDTGSKFAGRVLVSYQAELRALRWGAEAMRAGLKERK